MIMMSYVPVPDLKLFHASPIHKNQFQYLIKMICKHYNNAGKLFTWKCDFPSEII